MRETRLKMDRNQVNMASDCFVSKGRRHRERGGGRRKKTHKERREKRKERHSH